MMISTIGVLLVLCLSGLSRATLKDYCSDVSFYDVIKYSTESRTCCHPILAEQCELKEERVCEDVAELLCEVVSWAECSSRTKPTQGKNCIIDYKDYDFKDCKKTKSTVSHTKQVPECKTVTKQNCVTEWDVDADGNKVWAGTEKCTPVSWEECKIVEKQVDFPDIKTECSTVSQIKWADFVEGTTELVEMDTTCELKSAVNCQPVTVNKCVSIEFEECSWKPSENCKPVLVHKPDQEKIHRKKCLTDGNSGNPVKRSLEDGDIGLEENAEKQPVAPKENLDGDGIGSRIKRHDCIQVNTASLPYSRYNAGSTSSFYRCQGKCLNDSTCKWFNWLPNNGGCWLLRYHRTGVKSDRSTKGWVTGPKYCY